MIPGSVHIPVLSSAVREAFSMPPGTVVDATAGGGGHTAILRELGHHVIAVDRDPAARARLVQRFAGDDGVRIEDGDFRSLERFAPVQGLLADLGLSSDQLADPDRGFSFSATGALDMRMTPSSAESAADLVERLSVPELAEIIRRYGEERAAGRIARAVAGRRFETAAEFAAAVRAVAGYRDVRINPATRTFQALRIAVNDELGQLEALLAAAPRILAPAGRVGIISFHSLEDRLVKQAFAEWLGPCKCPPGFPICTCGAKPCAKPLWKGLKSADDEEQSANPRARTARMRAMVMLGSP